MSLLLLLSQVVLLVIGMLAVAASAPDDIPTQAGRAAAALALTLALAQLRPRQFLALARPVFFGSLLLLAAVLVVGVGTLESPGTRRWLDLGFVRFQPSELAKLGLVLMLASFFSRRGVNRKLAGAVVMLGVTVALILLEPDLGTSVLTFALGLVLLFSAGVRFQNIGVVVILATAVALPLAGIFLERNPYILERLRGHSEAQAGDVQNAGYQLYAAQRDMSLGGLWGQGPLAPRFEYFADSTDMVIAPAAFTLGLLGVLTVFFAYFLIIHVATDLMRRAAAVRPMTPELHGASIMVAGAMFMIIGQAFINLTVVVGLAPVTGIPLPLLSFGFSSLLVVSVALAIMHSTQREVRRLERREAIAPPAAPPLGASD